MSAGTHPADEAVIGGHGQATTAGHLLSAVAKTGSGSMLSLLLGAATVKVFALVLGPSGVGLFSVLRQMHQSSVTVATLNGQMALVQGLSSRTGRAAGTYGHAVARVFMLGAGVMALGLLAGAGPLAAALLGATDPRSISAIRWLAVPVLLMAGYLYLGGILVAQRAVGRLALAQVFSVATMAALAYPAARMVEEGRPQAITALLAVTSGVGFGAALLFVMRAGWLPPLPAGREADSRAAAVRHFMRIAGTMLVTGGSLAATHLAIRAMAARALGLDGAGVFDVGWTVGMLYVALMLTAFQSYYLPELSRTVDPHQRNLLVNRVLRFALLLVLPLVTALLVAAPLAVRVLYSGAFLEAVYLMRWMLLGDFVKVAAWVLAMPLLAYADMRVFLWSELVWHGLLLVGSAVALLHLESLAGVGIVFAGLYGGYLAFIVVYVRRRFGVAVSATQARWWAAGFMVTAGALLHTGRQVQLDPLAVVMWPALAFALCAASLQPGEWRRLGGLLRGRGS